MESSNNCLLSLGNWQIYSEINRSLPQGSISKLVQQGSAELFLREGAEVDGFAEGSCRCGIHQPSSSELPEKSALRQVQIVVSETPFSGNYGTPLVRDADYTATWIVSSLLTIYLQHIPILARNCIH
jgi:hypothetical protein